MQPRQLEVLARDHGLADVRVAGAFWFPIQPMVWLASRHLTAPAVADHWRSFLAVAELDLREAVPQSRRRGDGDQAARQATAVKWTARAEK